MSYSGKRLLLVEDNDMNRMMANIAFSDFEFEIDEATDGKEAIDIIMEKPEGYYDIIFMDILMPNMDGIEATTKIRAIERVDTMTVPIIAMTAESDPGEIEKYPDYGFSGYIEKPMDMDDVEEILEQYLD